MIALLHGIRNKIGYFYLKLRENNPKSGNSLNMFPDSNRNIFKKFKFSSKLTTFVLIEIFD